MNDEDQILEFTPTERAELIRMLALPTMEERHAAFLEHLEKAEQETAAIDAAAELAALSLLLSKTP